MRVIAGTLGGHQINSPKRASTHPMSDKVRGGLFNSLGDITDLEVLDVFSGSGALAIEAVSRGAKKAVAIESDKRSNNVIKTNIKNLNLGSQIKAINAYFSSWSNKNKDKQFDIIFADPPYDDLQINQLGSLIDHLKNSGLIVLSWPGKSETINLLGLEIKKVKNYGDAQLVFYQKIS